MENKTEKIFVGSGKEKFEGNMVQTSLCLTDITNNAKEFIFEFEGKKYIKLNVCKKREIDQYGKSHYVEVDTWKPEPKKQQVQQDDDLPF
jgi:hypothetical protein